jgi:hypothetical protein
MMKFMMPGHTENHDAAPQRAGDDKAISQPAHLDHQHH